jgi:enoyl-CoA hydratase/carnithine racemase
MAEADASVACVVLTGAGGQFCHGLAPGREHAGGPYALDDLRRWTDALRTYPKPVLAAVEGVARGAGFELALACDLLIASQEARFMIDWQAPGDGLLVGPRGGPMHRLACHVTRARLLEWLWMQDGITPAELARHDFVCTICAAGQACATALDTTARLAERPADRLAAAKERANAIDDARQRAAMPVR